VREKKTENRQRREWDEQPLRRQRTSESANRRFFSPQPPMAHFLKDKVCRDDDGLFGSIEALY
jgi:hypothetical protein